MPSALLVTLLLAVAVVLVVVVILWEHRSPGGLSSTLRRAAGTLRGSLTSPQEGEFRIDFASGERSARIEVAVADEPPHMTSITIELAAPSPGALKIVPTSAHLSLQNLPGASNLRTGDADFDDAYVVLSNPLSLAARLFDLGRSERIRRLVRSLCGCRVDLSRNSFTFRVESLPASDERLLRWVGTACQLLEEILLAGTDDGSVLWVDGATAEVGQCQVCGTPMRSNLVACSRCRTPHHEECWEYVGRCSTYACGERRFDRI